jgi:S-adenosylmethionine-diacylglycerol 3-amino-3-carboxypropyl transferase
MSKDFFLESLNYSMANEDTRLEQSISSKLQSESILSVCGSGSRAFPLITGFTKDLDLIDMSRVQLDFAKLRENSIKELEYAEFLDFWGYRSLEGELRKKRYLGFLKKSQPMLEDLFERENWENPIYYGGWEKTYHKLNKLVKIAVGAKRIDQLKKCQNLEEQLQVFNSFSFQLRWRSVLLIVGNRALFNSLLYKGKFVKKNISDSYVQFYIKAFRSLFNNTMLKNSYFLQMSFLGKIEYLAGVPVEAEEATFNVLKENIQKTNLNYINKNIIEYFKENTKTYDLISLSDVPSYFDDDLGTDFLQVTKPSVNSGGVLVVRYYLKTHRPDETGYVDISGQFKELIDAEGVQMYEIKVYQKI